jgi:DNA-binding XRE family transcriptional regulator
MQRFDAQSHAALRPSLWARRLAFGPLVLTLSVKREAECTQMPERIANRVAALRRERGLSRKQAADQLHIHVSTLTAIEQGEYLPSLRLALRVSELFNLPVGAIFFSPAREENSWPELLFPTEEGSNV